MTLKKQLIICGFSIGVFGCADLSLEQVMQTGLDVSQAVSQSELNYGKAIKETLELSSTRAASKLSETGGYSNNPLYKIKMPDSLSTVTDMLRTFGLNKQVDKVELLMNQGAEQAAIEAKAVFIKAVKEMTITDALGIIQGSETAATDYFKAKTESNLRTKYLPIIQDNLNKVGFYNQYKTFLNSYNSLPINDKPDLDLEQHVLNQSLTGLFSQVAKEESSIRQDPIGKGNEFLSKIFSK